MNVIKNKNIGTSLRGARTQAAHGVLIDKRDVAIFSFVHKTTRINNLFEKGFRFFEDIPLIEKIATSCMKACTSWEIRTRTPRNHTA
jgi:hypothetical protein